MVDQVTAQKLEKVNQYLQSIAARLKEARNGFTGDSRDLLSQMNLAEYFILDQVEEIDRILKWSRN